jgi:hypothetical protein
MLRREPGRHVRTRPDGPDELRRLRPPLSGGDLPGGYLHAWRVRDRPSAGRHQPGRSSPRVASRGRSARMGSAALARAAPTRPRSAIKTFASGALISTTVARIRVAALPASAVTEVMSAAVTTAVTQVRFAAIAPWAPAVAEIRFAAATTAVAQVSHAAVTTAVTQGIRAAVFNAWRARAVPRIAPAVIQRKTTAALDVLGSLRIRSAVGLLASPVRRIANAAQAIVMLTTAELLDEMGVARPRAPPRRS